MREIKFRAKSLNGVWVYGDLVHYNHSHTHISIVEKECKEQYFVHPQTICQFTSFQDSKCHDIYEGDILRLEIQPYNPGYNGNNYRSYIMLCECKWLENEGRFAYHRIQPNDKKRHSRNWQHKSMSSVEVKYAEVIGNIHDNPELMEANQ